MGRKRRTNQRFHGCNRMEFEKIDEQVERKFFAIYFSPIAPAKFILPRRLKLYFKERLINQIIYYIVSKIFFISLYPLPTKLA